MKHFLLLLLFCFTAYAQPAAIRRNFFTINPDPVVEVVAGSNATVQASTPDSQTRRFTVNAVPGGGTAQTNISWVAVTNLQLSQMPLTVITNAGNIGYSNASAFLTPAQIGTAAYSNTAAFLLFNETALKASFVADISTNQIPLSGVTNAGTAAYSNANAFATPQSVIDSTNNIQLSNQLALTFTTTNYVQGVVSNSLHASIIATNDLLKTYADTSSLNATNKLNTDLRTYSDNNRIAATNNVQLSNQLYLTFTAVPSNAYPKAGTSITITTNITATGTEYTIASTASGSGTLTNAASSLTSTFIPVAISAHGLTNSKISIVGNVMNIANLNLDNARSISVTNLTEDGKIPLTVVSGEDYNGDLQQWIYDNSVIEKVDVYGRFLGVTPLAKTTNYSLTIYDRVILANGAITLTLPLSATANAGRIFTITCITNSTVTITNAGDQLIHFRTKHTLYGTNDSLQVVSTGSGYVAMSPVASALFKTPTNAPANAQVLTADGTHGDTKWAAAAGGGSQTPWTSQITNAGYALWLTTNNLGTTTRDILNIQNTLVSEANAPQFSPALKFIGSAYNEGGGSETMDARLHLKTIGDTTSAGLRSELLLDFATAGGSYVNRFSFFNNGTLVCTNVTASELISGKWIELSGQHLTGSAGAAASAKVIEMVTAWDTTGTPTAIRLSVSGTNSGAGSLLMDLRTNGVSQFRVGKQGNVVTTGTITGNLSPATNLPAAGVQFTAASLLGRSSAGVGEQITIGAGLDLTGTTLTITNYVQGVVSNSLHASIIATNNNLLAQSVTNRMVFTNDSRPLMLNLSRSTNYQSANLTGFVPPQLLAPTNSVTDGQVLAFQLDGKTNKYVTVSGSGSGNVSNVTAFTANRIIVAASGYGVTSSIVTLAAGAISGATTIEVSASFDALDSVGGGYKYDGTKVVGARGAAVDNAAEDLVSVTAQLNALLARLRAHGLIDP